MRQAYLDRAAQSGGRIQTVPGERSVEEIKVLLEQIVSVLL